MGRVLIKQECPSGSFSPLEDVEEKIGSNGFAKKRARCHLAAPTCQRWGGGEQLLQGSASALLKPQNPL